MPRANQISLPRFPLPAIFRLRNSLYDLLVLARGRTPEKETFQTLCQAIGATFKLSPQMPAIFETVRSLPLQPLTASDLWLLAWRVAANAELLDRGLAIRPWSGQLDREWVPLEIMSTAFLRHERFGSGYTFTMRILAGSPAGEIVEKFWSASSMNRHARDLGFTSHGKKKLPYRSVRQCVRLRLVGLLEPELCADGPMFRNYGAQGAILNWNKKVLKQRIFRNPPCPYAFQHACHDCPVGYAKGAQTCPVGTRAVSLEYRECPSCHEGCWFDPERGLEVCGRCWKNAEKAEEVPVEDVVSGR